jgi:hypothetical protein
MSSAEQALAAVDRYEELAQFAGDSRHVGKQVFVAFILQMSSNLSGRAGR